MKKFQEVGISRDFVARVSVLDYQYLIDLGRFYVSPRFLIHVLFLLDIIIIEMFIWRKASNVL